MKPRTMVMLITALTFAVLLGYFFRVRFATDEIEAQLQSVEKRVATLRHDLRAAKGTASDVSIPAPTLAESANASPTPKPKLPPPPPSFMDIARDNPQLLNLMIADRKAQLRQRYGALFVALSLSREQQEKFKDIMATQAARDADIDAARREKGLEYEDSVVQRLYQDSEKQRETELAALLGEKDYSTYREFERTLRVRGFADGLAVQLATTEPLRPAQADALTRMLDAASTTNAKVNDADPLTVDWAAVDRAASSILSPAQFAVWQRGLAHNPYGGSRSDIELQKIFDTALAKDEAESRTR